jgi:hypothetical protein
MLSEHLQGINIVRKIYGPIKEDKRWRKRTSKGIQDTSQGEGIVIFIKSLI